MHAGEEIGHGHQQVRAVDLVEAGVRARAPAVCKGTERAGKQGQPLAQVFAAHNAAQHVVVRMA